MRKTILTVLATAALTLGAVAAVIALTTKPAHASGTPSGTQVIQQKVVLRWPVKSCDNRFLVEDQSTAPMASISCNGLQSWGEPVCIIIKAGQTLEPDACLGGPPVIYKDGDSVPALVTLWHDGKAYSLTARDITWIHAHGG